MQMSVDFKSYIARIYINNILLKSEKDLLFLFTIGIIPHELSHCIPVCCDGQELPVLLLCAPRVFLVCLYHAGGMAPDIHVEMSLQGLL